jgi:acyl carrier protein
VKEAMPIKEKLKKMLVEELNLEDVSPEDIDDDAPLFGDGLGLDSLDAVELVVLIQKHFGVEIKDMEEGRPALQSVNSLAAFIEAKAAP